MKGKVYSIFRYIKNHGIINSIPRVFGDVLFSLLSPIFMLFFNKIVKVHENRIVFQSLPSFSDNAKAMYDYLRSIDSTYDFVWLVEDIKDIPLHERKNTKVARLFSKYHWGNSIKAMYYISSCKTALFTHVSPMRKLPHKDKQVVINLWHGCGYKDKGSKSSEMIDYFDYALVPGKVFVGVKAHFWNCREDMIWPIGYPRYDKLLTASKDGEKLYYELKGKSDRLIVWMPTFRKTGRSQFPEETINQPFELPIVKDEKELKIVNEYALKNGITICIKRHPFQKKYLSEEKKFSNLVFIDQHTFASREVDMYSFLRYADALISDYSSVAVDFLLLDKPIAFALDDYDQYKEKRGFVFENPLQYMPGHHVYNVQDLLLFLNDVRTGSDPYHDSRAQAMPEMQHLSDHYCKDIWNKIQSLDK